AEFINFYLTNGSNLSKEVGYVPLPTGISKLVMERFNARTVGTLFAQGHQVGITLEQLMRTEKAS
ncbi:MAG: hypothetical protein K1X79_10610, partial [Oligoflexia bacterium]|nr:hypothetical protein [Oligoflexia bacterium]